MYLYSVLHALIMHNLHRSDRSDIFREITGKHFNVTFASVFISTTNPSRQQTNLIKVLGENKCLQVYDRKIAVDLYRDVKSEATMLLFEGYHTEQVAYRRLREFRDTFSWNPRGKIIIVGDGPPVNYMRSLWRISKAVNVVFWSYRANEFYTWEPYKKGECDVIKTIHRVSDKDLFKPVNLMNLNGCPLVACSETLPPFVLFPINRRFTQGIESEIMDMVAEKMNGNLSYAQIPQINGKSIGKDGRDNGFVGLLDRQEVDIVFSGLMIVHERIKTAEPLTTHGYDELVWLVPPPGKGSSLRGFFRVFSPPIWVISFMALAIAGLLMYFRGRRILFGKCVMDVISIGMMYSVKRKDRYIPTLTYFGAIHIGCAYQAMLLSSLVRINKVKPFETLEELLNANIFFYVPPTFTSLLNVTGNHLWDGILQPGRHEIAVDPMKIIGGIAKKKTSAALYPKYFSAYVINTLFPDGNYGPKVMTLKDRVLPMFIAFFTPRGHPLAPVMDHMIRQLVNGGFAELWLRRYLKYDLSLMGDVRKEGTGKPLSVKNLRVILYIYVFLNGLAILSFFGEILYKKYKNRPKRKTRQ